MRALEAFLIGVVFSLFAAYACASTLLAPPAAHRHAASRALAWLLLTSDSAPYLPGLASRVLEAVPDAAYLDFNGTRTQFANATADVTIRAVWLGCNGTLRPVEVVVGVKP